jgi:dTDP-4-dehydrorhamnose 3,5-epimerase and related enzymes
MQFQPLAIPGAFRVKSESMGDERGWFARAFCQRELAEHGVDFQVRQINRSFNQKAGTVRGFHFQFPPHAENKFLRCVRVPWWMCWWTSAPSHPPSCTRRWWSCEQKTTRRC